MTTFDSQLADDFDNVFLNSAEFAREIIYRSVDDLLTDSPLDVIFNNAHEEVNIAENYVAITDPHIYFRLAALGVTPQIGDQVVIDSVVYTVQAPPQEDGSGAVRIYLTEPD